MTNAKPLNGPLYTTYNKPSPNNKELPSFCEEPIIENATHRRPAFEKILIGPLMCFAEDVAGGHYLEVLRLGKQMFVGQINPPSYLQLHHTFVAESPNGLWGAVYRGFFPWGMTQGLLKGAPVLFIQNETRYVLDKHRMCSPRTADQVSGCLSGAAQAIIMTPFQKLKVTIVANNTLNGMRPLHSCVYVVREQGLLSLFDGLMPTMIRRSVDWGIRFGACAEMKRLMIEHKQAKHYQSNRTNSNPPETLKTSELMICSLIGGALSGLTHPIDNIITNSQKPLPVGSNRDVLSVVQRMLSESGVRAFTRGWSMRILENSYHMIWIYGVGNILYDFMRTDLIPHQRSPQLH
jgi:hypothetical protein